MPRPARQAAPPAARPFCPRAGAHSPHPLPLPSAPTPSAPPASPGPLLRARSPGLRQAGRRTDFCAAHASSLHLGADPTSPARFFQWPRTFAPRSAAQIARPDHGRLAHRAHLGALQALAPLRTPPPAAPQLGVAGHIHAGRHMCRTLALAALLPLYASRAAHPSAHIRRAAREAPSHTVRRSAARRGRRPVAPARAPPGPSRAHQSRRDCTTRPRLPLSGCPPQQRGRRVNKRAGWLPVRPLLLATLSG